MPYKYTVRNFINIVENYSGEIPDLVYHGTSIPNAAMILSSNRMIPGEDDGPLGISFSTSRKVARGFADDDREFSSLLDYYVAPEAMAKIGRPSMDGALLTLHAAEIAERTRLIRYAHDGVDDEDELRAVTSSLENILPCIQTVEVRLSDIAWWKDAARLIIEQQNAESGYGERLLRGLIAMVRHPVISFT